MTLLLEALKQILFVFIFSLMFYIIHWIKNKKQKVSFKEFLSLNFNIKLFDKAYFRVLVCLIIYGVISTFIQINYWPELSKFIFSDKSPYGKILNQGVNYRSLFGGFLYCFLQAGVSEELLFRGLIGNFWLKKFGTFYGNLIQATIFWIFHLLIFKLITGLWISQIQLFIFITSFTMGLIFGYFNNRNNDRSLYPSLLLHSALNFSCFLTIAFHYS